MQQKTCITQHSVKQIALRLPTNNLAILQLNETVIFSFNVSLIPSPDSFRLPRNEITRCRRKKEEWDGVHWMRWHALDEMACRYAISEVLFRKNRIERVEMNLSCWDVRSMFRSLSHGNSFLSSTQCKTLKFNSFLSLLWIRLDDRSNEHQWLYNNNFFG